MRQSSGALVESTARSQSGRGLPHSKTLRARRKRKLVLADVLTWWRIAITALLLFTSVSPAATPEDLLREAQQLETDGSMQKAANLYQNFLKQNPGHSQAREAAYRLAKCFDNLGEVDQAIAHFKRATEGAAKADFKNRTEALYMLGKLQASLKDYDDATKTFDKLLGEGAGLYEDEVTNLAAGWYAIREKYDEAAAKFNLLRRKSDAKLAEQAAYKLGVLWLRAGKLDLAVAAIQDLAQQFPNNNQIPELLLKAADGFRRQKKFETTISICEQLKARYPKSVEALAGSYLLGLSYRDQKEPKKAVAVLDKVAKVREFEARGLAAEALLLSAEIYEMELSDVPTAMLRYEEAAKIARNSDSERKTQILEQCYFRLGEYYFRQEKWNVALENYTQVRALGTALDVSSRILECQSKVGKTENPANMTEAGVTALRAKIAQNPGTATAAEAEVFLLDRELREAIERKRDTAALAAEYEKLLASYPKGILSSEHLESYIHIQAGTALRLSGAAENGRKAITAFEQAIASDPKANPYQVPALEGIAAAADQIGDKARSVKAYAELFALSKQKLDENKADKALEQKTLDYLKSLVTRSDSGDMLEKAIAMTRKLIEEKGALSDLSANARYYLGELLIVKKDYSAAASTFKELIKVHGPPQNADGDLADAPWKPAGQNEIVQSVQDAASRVADAWYLQGHTQNMVRAYQWIVRNIPNNNRHMAEAQYWLAMESAKGEAGKTPEGKRKTAEALWGKVVASSFDTDAKAFKKSLQPWVGTEAAEKYVKSAMLKSGQLFGEGNEHARAARVFSAYLSLYPDDAKRQKGKGMPAEPRDEKDSIARYALGREYVALAETANFSETYKPYLDGFRGDRFRVSALKLLGFHAGKGAAPDRAMEAYATLLDEYGPTDPDPKTKLPRPLPRNQWLRQNRSGWDGIREAPPADLDLGEIRYALGFLYWKAEDWARCAQTLGPFSSDTALAKNKTRDKALFMAGQSYDKLTDFANGVKMIQALVRDYPRFDAIEEAYVKLAAGLAETKQWRELELVNRTFVNEWPRSDRRPRMDLYSAVADAAQGQREKAMVIFKSLIGGETFADLKADAGYYAGTLTLETNPNEPQKALEFFEKSVAAFPTDRACLEAAKCYQKTGKLGAARGMAERIGRDFPRGNPRVINEARALLPGILKELANKK